MAGWVGSTRRQRLPDDWPRRRASVLRRDGHRCQIRYPRLCIGLATQVDHVEAGDDHDERNLQAACGPCHARKSGREGARGAGAARRRRVAKRREPHPGLLPPGGWGVTPEGQHPAPTRHST